MSGYDNPRQLLKLPLSGSEGRVFSVEVIEVSQDPRRRPRKPRKIIRMTKHRISSPVTGSQIPERRGMR
jgi:hypothetical protein